MGVVREEMEGGLGMEKIKIHGIDTRIPKD